MDGENEMDELETIERYLARKLAVKEQQVVEEKIRHDPNFAMKVENLRHITRLLHTAQVEQRAKTALNSLYQQNRIRERRFLYQYRIGVGVVATCLLCLVYLALAPVNLPAITDDLYTVHGSTLPDSESTKPKSVYAQLQTGQKALQNENYLLAINYLEKIQQVKDLRPYFREAVQWNLVLAYIKSNQPRNAERIYQSLQQLDNPEYPVDWTERYKLYVQIQRRKLF
jgi:hypothetical protein